MPILPVTCFIYTRQHLVIHPRTIQMQAETRSVHIGTSIRSNLVHLQSHKINSNLLLSVLEFFLLFFALALQIPSSFS